MWEYTGSKRPPFAATPGPGQESVWDYPRPPKLVADKRHVVVRFSDIIIADTVEAYRVLETAGPPTFYIPPKDVRIQLLEPFPGTSACEWKGTADVLVAKSYTALATSDRLELSDSASSICANLRILFLLSRSRGVLRRR